MKIKKSDYELMSKIANKLGIIPSKLYTLINFESRWNPKIKNPIAGQTAKGLLQFIDKTARGLGFKSSLDLINKLPTVRLQLIHAVYPYLKKRKPYRNDQDLFMSVFYPKYRYKPSYMPFPKHVQKVNPGIRTPRDYIKMVYKYADKKNNIILYSIVGGVIFLSLGGFRYGRQRKN